jgi:hypothetical protein
MACIDASKCVSAPWLRRPAPCQRRGSCFDVPVMPVFGIDSMGGRSGSVHQCELPGSAAEKHQRLDGQLPAIGLKMNYPLLAIGEVEEIGKTDFSLATRRNTSS